MKIIVDAMGGDNAPKEIIKGAVMAAEEFGVDIILTGRGEEILKAFDLMGMRDLPKGIEVAHASEVVDMHDDPATAVRVKKDSSLTVGLKMLADGVGDAFVSAGSTGAVLSGATLIVKRIKGIRRAALAPMLPGAGDGVLLIDCGANVECTPEYLLQFAFMGSYYMKSIKGMGEPRVGLLNNGAEESKGAPLQLETYALLKKAHAEERINFVGNVEARDVMLGACDVIVCDGFSGNILLKGIEGVGILFMKELKKIFMKNTATKLAAAMVKSEISDFKKRYDSSEIGGTALLGITKPVIKAHGSSDAYSIRSSILQAINHINAGLAEDIQDNIEYMRVN